MTVLDYRVKEVLAHTTTSFLHGLIKKSVDVVNPVLNCTKILMMFSTSQGLLFLSYRQLFFAFK